MAKDVQLTPIDLLVIGGSAGSLEVIIQLLPELPLRIPFAVIVVVHRKGGESVLTELLMEKTSMGVKEADEKEPILPGNLYIAPPDYHLLVEKDKTLSIDFSEKLHYSRPSIDATFETAAEAYGPRLACILLSGANADGAEGLRYVKELGGRTIVQDPAEAAVPYMPQQALAAFAVDHVAGMSELIELVRELAQLEDR